MIIKTIPVTYSTFVFIRTALNENKEFMSLSIREIPYLSYPILPGFASVISRLVVLFAQRMQKNTFALSDCQILHLRRVKSFDSLQFFKSFHVVDGKGAQIAIFGDNFAILGIVIALVRVSRDAC